jgi:hypothetical protein
MSGLGFFEIVGEVEDFQCIMPMVLRFRIQQINPVTLVSIGKW